MLNRGGWSRNRSLFGRKMTAARVFCRTWLETGQNTYSAWSAPVTLTAVWAPEISRWSFLWQSFPWCWAKHDHLLIAADQAAVKRKQLQGPVQELTRVFKEKKTIVECYVWLFVTRSIVYCCSSSNKAMGTAVWFEIRSLIKHLPHF